MTTCFVTLLFLCQILVSYDKPLNRGPKEKQISVANILEPEVCLQMKHDYLQNKINTLYLELLLTDSLIENQNLNKNPRSLKRRRKPQIRRQLPKRLDGRAEERLSQLTRRQYRRRGNRGDLVPFPRVG
jgi:hypothetical protein